MPSANDLLNMAHVGGPTRPAKSCSTQLGTKLGSETSVSALGIGGSNYDSLIVRTVAFPVQLSSLLDSRGHGPLRIQCPMSTLTSGPETWPWGPVGWGRSLHDRVSRVPASKLSPRAKLESDRY